MDEAAIAEALRQWRAAHPQASWDEIETEVQRQLAGLQAAWMAELAGASSASAGEPVVPTCPECGAVLRPCGQRTRQLLTRMGQAVALERAYSVRPACGAGVSPLDEALGLPAHGPYSPQVLSWLDRLGATLPCARAAALLSELTRIPVSASTLRRQTEALGATAVAEAEGEVARLEREVPRPAVAPARLVLEADGAQVPLVRGEWAEMKQVSVGEPAPARGPAGAPRPTRLRAVSYFARLDDAETFGRQALGEVHRRGVETARAVAAVQDGAAWLQGFVDRHRPDALRIRDWPHAAQQLTAVAEALCGGGCGKPGPTGCYPCWPAGSARRPSGACARTSRVWRRRSPTSASGARSWTIPPSARRAGR